MKKKILLILIPLLTAGCTINYDLTIDSDTIIEEAKITIPISQVTDYGNYQTQINTPRPVYIGNGKNYNMSEDEDEDNYYVSYKYKHDINYYSKSSFLNTCYEKNNIKITDDQIIISTSNVFKCISMEDGYRADSADINIKTKLKVTENNADEVKGNTYIWHMNSYEYSDKPINITIEKNKTAAEKINKTIQNPYIVMIIIFLGVVVLGTVIYFFIKTKQTQKNKF